MAYYAIFSIVPITYIAVVFAGFFVDAAMLSAGIQEQLEILIGPEAVEQFTAEVVALANRTTQGSTLASLISFIVLLFTASLIFFQLQYVLNKIWNVPPPSRDATSAYIRNRLLAFVMVLLVGLVLVLATAANLFISWLTSLTGYEDNLFLINTTVSGLLLTLSLAPIYKVLPNVEIKWRDVWLGSALTAFLIVFAIELFTWLVKSNRFNSPLQAAGTVATFLLSFYFFGTIFVLGAVFIRVYTSEFGSHKALAEEIDD